MVSVFFVRLLYEDLMLVSASFVILSASSAYARFRTIMSHLVTNFTIAVYVRIIVPCPVNLALTE